ncbi:hypothetical protein FDZ71_00405 [bacterium]|nr:MAG: hypothetical protein FDZ71_00405 [bacterium]
MNEMDVRDFPCCMCPADADIRFIAARCDNCDFAVTFEDVRGYRYFVRSGLGDVGFKTFYTVPGKARQKSCLVFKAWRPTFAAAQEDLNRVAKERKWIPVERT